MSFVFYNPNPLGQDTIDCTVRAISKLMGFTWDKTYMRLALEGFRLKSMPTADRVWGNYLRNNGFTRHMIPDMCPDCYTVAEFAHDHPVGKYLLKTSEHVVAVCGGNYYDSFDSGGEVPIYYWERSADHADV